MDHRPSRGRRALHPRSAGAERTGSTNGQRAEPLAIPPNNSANRHSEHLLLPPKPGTNARTRVFFFVSFQSKAKACLEPCRRESRIFTGAKAPIPKVPIDAFPTRLFPFPR